MNKNLFGVILGLVGLVAFFLPWFTGFLGGMSGLQILQMGLNWELYEVLLILLIPVAFLLMLIFRIVNKPNISLAISKIIDFIPLVLIVATIIVGLDRMGFTIEEAEYIDSSIFNVFGTGLILTLVVSIVILFVPLKKDQLK